MRVVVTGATGNIGSALLPELAARPEVDEIVGVTRRAPKWDLAKVRWHAASIERDDLRRIFAGADAVVHLVWIIQPSRDPEQQRIVNIVGTERMLAAAADSDVRAVIHASSVGAYSPGPRDRAVDEQWPTGGNAVLAYSWQKAYAERLLDRFERDRPSVRVVRLRPALVMQRSAGREVKHYFLGRLLPNPVVQPSVLLPILDRGPLRLQAVHAADVGRAFAPRDHQRRRRSVQRRRAGRRRRRSPLGPARCHRPSGRHVPRPAAAHGSGLGQSGRIAADDGHSSDPRRARLGGGVVGA